MVFLCLKIQIVRIAECRGFDDHVGQTFLWSTKAFSASRCPRDLFVFKPFATHGLNSLQQESFKKNWFAINWILRTFWRCLLFFNNRCLKITTPLGTLCVSRFVQCIFLSEDYVTLHGFFLANLGCYSGAARHIWPRMLISHSTFYSVLFY